MGGVSERSNTVRPLLRRKKAIKLSQIFPMINATRWKSMYLQLFRLNNKFKRLFPDYLEKAECKAECLLHFDCTHKTDTPKRKMDAWSEGKMRGANVGDWENGAGAPCATKYFKQNYR